MHRKRKARLQARNGANMVSSTNLSMCSSLVSAMHGPFILSLLRSFYAKAQEFRTWLLEERKINPEAISKDREKKEFSKFVEDFNTGTSTMLCIFTFRLHPL
jgi:hypothetical protein